MKKTILVVFCTLVFLACATTDYNDQGVKIREEVFTPVPTIEAVTEAYEVYEDSKNEDKETKEGE